MPDSPGQPDEELLTVAEVAALFDVGPRTVIRWANAGGLPTVNKQGQRRQAGSRKRRYFRLSEIAPMLPDGTVIRRKGSV